MVGWVVVIALARAPRRPPARFGGGGATPIPQFGGSPDHIHPAQHQPNHSQPVCLICAKGMAHHL